MKNLLLLTFILANYFAYSQDNNLYVGYVGWSGSLQNKLTIIDTTGNNFSAVGAAQLTLTTDIGDAVSGTYGLAVHPISGEMYILYRTNIDGVRKRRLGTLNTSTGLITDIGITDGLKDITFVNGTLYGTTGTLYGDYQLVRINLDDASITNVITYIEQEKGAGICYNYYTGLVIKIDRGSKLEIIDVSDITDVTSSVIPYGGHPGNPMHASTLLDEFTTLTFARDELYEFDIDSRNYTLLTTFPAEAQAITFGSYPSDAYVASIAEKTQVEAPNFSIYPSPSAHLINIEYTTETLVNYEATIMDITGKIILTQTILPNAQNQFNIEKLSNGVYFVNITHKNETYTYKVIKE